MESVKKFVYKVVDRIRGSSFTAMSKRQSKKSKKEAKRRESVQIVSYRQRNQGTIIHTPVRQTSHSELQKKSSEELDQRLNTIRARRRQSRGGNDNLIYTGSLLRVSFTRHCPVLDNGPLPPLNVHFAASNISTFIERLTFSQTARGFGHDHSTPMVGGGRDSLTSPPRTNRLALPFLHEDDNTLETPHQQSGCRQLSLLS